jgi:hypothetical protein
MIVVHFWCMANQDGLTHAKGLRRKEKWAEYASIFSFDCFNGALLKDAHNEINRLNKIENGRYIYGLYEDEDDLEYYEQETLFT